MLELAEGLVALQRAVSSFLEHMSAEKAGFEFDHAPIEEVLAKVVPLLSSVGWQSYDAHSAGGKINEQLLDAALQYL